MKRQVLFPFFILIFFLTPKASSAQNELPKWVEEMKKTPINYSLLSKEFNEYWKDKMMEPGETDRKFEEDEFSIREEFGWLRFYIRQYNEIIKTRLRPNIAYNKNLKNSVSARNTMGQWTLAGPKIPPKYVNPTGSNFGIGRVNQLAFSGTHPNIIYALAPAGLFISTDTANTWHSSGTDFIGFHQFRSIAVDPTNDSIIYLGNGDYISNGLYETGVLKSIDFGNSFTPLSNGMDTTLITTIIIDRLNPNHIIAGGWKGIWSSNDGGASWKHNYLLDPSNKIQDIKFKPFNSDTIYATSNTEFLISTDGGNSWKTGFNDFQFSSTFVSELLLGVSDAAPNYVYIATMQDFGNIYKSTDSGASFLPTKLNALPGLIGYDTGFSFGQGDYDFTFNADPFDPLKLYIGSISFYTSKDGGKNWKAPYYSWSSNWYNTRLHPDQHYIARNPLVPDRIWVANDGGVYSKLDIDSTFVPKQNGLAVTQAYHFDADNYYDSTFAIGTQDNGACFTNNGTNFYTIGGGDVFAKIYSLYNYNAAIYATGSNIDMHTGSGGYPLNLPDGDNNEAMSFTPVTPATGFIARTHIWETNDLNANPVLWRKIYNNSNSNNYFMNASHCLADSSIFYAVRSDGYLFRTSNAMDVAPVFDSIELPISNLWPASIATVSNNDSVLYLCTYDTVYLSYNRGETWTSITNDLNTPFGFYEIVADPFVNDGSVYLAASNKMYYKNDATKWIVYSNQLPDVTTVFDITVKKFNSQVRKVMADLLDRGIWESPVYQNIITKVPEQKNTENLITVFPIPGHNNLTIKTEEINLMINRIIIYNQRGQQISKTKEGINKQSVGLDVSNFTNGMYYIEVITNLGSVIKKFVISK